MKHRLCILLASCLPMATIAATTYTVNYNLEELSYTIDERNQTATITRIKSRGNTKGNIALPSKLDGYPVTKIENSAYYGKNSGVVREGYALIIPENVVEIGAGAFSQCAVSEVKIPTTLKKVGANAFLNCPNIEKVQIEDLSAWCQIDFANDTSNPLSRRGAFATPFDYRDYWNEYQSTGRGLWLFSGYSMYGSKQYQVITTLDIPDGITSLKPYLFAGDSHIYTVNIPASCAEIGEGAFINSSIEAVNFSASVQTIGSKAFYGCRGLKELRIPDGVMTVGSYAFSQCHGLTSVQISNGVQEIAADAFASTRNLNNLKTVSGPHRFRSLFASEPTAYASYTYTDAIITFDANGGLVSSPSITVELGATVGTLPAPVKSGHTFDGWFTAINGGTMISSDTTASRDATYYAHWTEIRHTVTFNANGGECDEVDRTCTELEGIGELPIPTREDYQFDGWFTEIDGGSRIEESTVVSNDATFFAHWTEEAVTEVAMPRISPEDGAEFVTENCQVVITCDTRNSTIYYSTKGTPRQTAAYEYTGPFYVSDTVTIKAIAVKRGCKSEYATATITKKELSLQEVLESPSLEFSTGGDAAWGMDSDESAVGRTCARSGKIGLNQESWLEVALTGAGQLAFDWRVSCEQDDSGDCSWDRLECVVDGVEYRRIDGTPSGWERCEVEFRTDGAHVVRWRYIKDDYDDDGADFEDCAWVDNVAWTPKMVVNVGVSGDKGEIEEVGGRYVVTAKDGKTLTDADFIFTAVQKEAYKIDIAADGKSATVALAAPQIAVAATAKTPEDVGDPAGILVVVPDDKISAKPTPKNSESVGALPVKTYPGLFYQASWGAEPNDLASGEKVQATTDTLYLGVIKQTGKTGFYRLSVSEK